MLSQEDEEGSLSYITDINKDGAPLPVSQRVYIRPKQSEYGSANLEFMEA